MTRPLGLVAALPMEVRSVRARATPWRVGDLPFWVVAGGRAVAVAAGMGEERAARAARTLAARVELAGLVATGFAAGLHPGLRRGNLFVATEVGDGRAEPRPVHGPWLLMAKVAAADAGGAFGSGLLLSGTRVVVDPAAKAALGAATGALAYDLESAAVAGVAVAAGMPFLAVRAISDPVDEALPAEAETLLTARGRVNPLAVARALWRRPGLAGELLQARRGARAAAATLGGFYARFLAGLP